MCNLYRMTRTVDEVAQLFGAVMTSSFDWPAEIYPKMTAPVVIAAQGERRLGPMAWGFPTEVQGKTKRLTKHVTNARNLNSPLWRPSLARRRCLVPFTMFAEPAPGKDAAGRPAQHWFTLADQPVAAFAGLWRPTDSGPVFAFCTTAPNALVAPLHPKAMPVVLMAEDHDRWLAAEPDAALPLVAPYPSQLMQVTTTTA